jgi:hypothetical protein
VVAISLVVGWWIVGWVLPRHINTHSRFGFCRGPTYIPVPPNLGPFQEEIKLPNLKLNMLSTIIEAQQISSL